MKTWKGYIQVNGDGAAIFGTPEIDIPDELYEEIQEAIYEGKPLRECGFYQDLTDRVEQAFNLAEYLGITDEEPDRDLYENEKDYSNAMQEYQQRLESVWDEYFLEYVGVEDPGDLERMKEKFVGDIYPDFTGQEEHRFHFDYETDTLIAQCSLAVHFDPEGKITDITNVYAEGLSSETEKYSNYEECYPDYNLIADILEEKLSDGP